MNPGARYGSPGIDAPPKPGKATKGPLRALIVEDSEDDCELLLRELRKGAYEPVAERVETAETMAAALDRQSWDVVFSDWTMPSFSAHGALEVLREKGVDVPFIIVSGTVGEDIAVEALKTGAHDFLVKSKLARFLPAVERELREAKVRREHSKMREQLMRRELEAAEARAARELAQVRSEMLKDLEAKNALLNEADRRKNEFLAMLSHELRNPLAPICNSLYILDRTSPGGEQARRAKAVIDRQVGYLSRLIDDLLDVTRIVRGKIRLQRERLDLNELVHRTVEDHRSLFSVNDVQLETLEATAEVRVSGDRTRLVQVIGNLLQNAAKFTPRGGKATVSIQADTERMQAILMVCDTGTGIPAEIRPRLFEAFAQADAALDRSKGGLGLGLALVKGLVELHGGTVDALSNGPGEGAAFTIRLPLDTSTAPAVAAPRIAAGYGAPCRVLIIEDNHDAADSLSEALVLGGHEVAVAYDGSEGLTKARKFQPKVVLCDIGLPGIDGFDVARAFRADEKLKGTYLVALSGYALPEDLQRAQEAGFDQHLAKPPSLEKLEELLGSMCPLRAVGGAERGRK